MSPFMAFLEYQPSLFKFQEEEVLVPSVLANLQQSCRSLWRRVHSGLLRSSLQSQRQANCHRVLAPSYWPSLFSRDLPVQETPVSRFLFLASTRINHVINLSTVPLKLLSFTPFSTFLELGQSLTQVLYLLPTPLLPRPSRGVQGIQSDTS